MYQGLHPRTRLLRWSLFLGAVVIVLAATSATALDTVSGWLAHEHDRLPWYVTRISAFLAYLALACSVVYGLLLSTKLLDRIAHRAVSFTLHQDLASIGLALALVHAAVLMIDRSVPYTLAEVAVPFIGPYEPLWVGVGQIALGLTVVVLLSFYVRKRIGQKTWRRIHFVSFLAFLAATVHGLMAGTDSGAGWAFAGYVIASSAVLALLTYRIAQAAAVRRSQVTSATAAASSSASRSASTRQDATAQTL